MNRISTITFWVILIVSKSLLSQNILIIEVKESPWVIELNDEQILVPNDTTLKVDDDMIIIRAQPQINYTWPSIFLSDTLNFSTHDTVFYLLDKRLSKGNDKSIRIAEESEIISNQMPDIKTYGSDNKNYKWIKNSLIISAVVTNWLSFYMKNRADDSYEKYKSASSLDKIDKYYKRTTLYDNYSNVLLGVSLATLSGYIYMTLTEK